MKCWPTTPFDVAPQMKNVPARIQNVHERVARRMIPGSAWSGSGGVWSVAPRASSPTSDGRSRSRIAAGTAAAISRTAIASVACRQPSVTAITVSSGKKISWPALELAPNTPTTRPRPRTNQRFAITGPSELATSPAPNPATRPNSSTSCHSSRENDEAPIPNAVSSIAPTVSRRMPNRSMSRPETGPPRPSRRSPAAPASETSATDQPVSAWMPRSSAPGAARVPAPMSTQAAATSRTIQPYRNRPVRDVAG